MGIEAVGVTADLQYYALIRWFQLREVGATAQAPIVAPATAIRSFWYSYLTLNEAYAFN